MAPAIHPGRLLRRELEARKLSANRLALDLGVPSGRVTELCLKPALWVTNSILDGGLAEFS